MDVDDEALLKGESASHRRLDFETIDTENEGVEDKSSSANFLDVCTIHSKISKEDIPEIGMEFKTEEAAYDFYNAYAKKVGFGIRRSKFHVAKNSSIILDRIFCCSREGKRGNNKRNAIVKNSHPESRCHCLAMMKVNCRQTGKYRVVEFFAEHNHSVTTPSKSHLHRSHRKITPAQAAEADMADNCGIAPKATLEFMSRQRGGREYLGFIPDDYKNYLRTKRTMQMRVGDTGGVLEYLQGMKSKDPNFFYGIQVDQDDLITNIFWADAKMMTDYSYFGDVICFDTTYRTNKDGRPIALFVGVNHHKQSIIFGGALLYDETTETFKWLFDTFAKAMSGKKPKTILTDQDRAMSSALASQWPETCHRLCIWHIYQNAAINLSGVFAKFKDFTKDFSSCIYDYEEEDDFLEAWSEMIEKYELQENEWLKTLFSKKEKWALVYGRETFCADMTTTQRSESMNSVIKRYVDYKHDLLRFFGHFQRLVDDRRYDELRADFRANQTTPSLPFLVEIMKHAATIYSPEVLKSIQCELFKSYDSNIKDCGEFGSVTKYEITPFKKKYHHKVSFDSSDNTISCSCKKFEFAGYLCSHAFKVLSAKNIVKIPERYILRRWTREAKKGNRVVTCESTAEIDPKARLGVHYRDLCSLSTQLVTRAVESEKAYGIARQGLLKLLEEVDTCLDEKVTEKTSLIGTLDANKGVPDVYNIEHTEGTEELIGKKVRGIKFKPRDSKKGGKRYMGALEKMVRSKRSKKGASHPTITGDDHAPQNNQMSQSSQAGTNNVTQSSPFVENIYSWLPKDCLVPSPLYTANEVDYALQNNNISQSSHVGKNHLTQGSQFIEIYGHNLEANGEKILLPPPSYYIQQPDCGGHNVNRTIGQNFSSALSELSQQNRVGQRHTNLCNPEAGSLIHQTLFFNDPSMQLPQAPLSNHILNQTIFKDNSSLTSHQGGRSPINFMQVPLQGSEGYHFDNTRFNLPKDD